MTALQKIQVEAKKLRKANPKMAYKDAIKKASIAYNKTKKIGAAPKKKTASKLPIKKIVTTVTKEKMGSISLMQVGSQLQILEKKIAAKKLQKQAAKYVADKKIIQSEITILNRQFKALKSYLNTIARFKKK